MKIGDLVCWHNKQTLLGIVTEATNGDGILIQACRVQWLNGVTSNHSTEWLTFIKTSETIKK